MKNNGRFMTLDIQSGTLEEPKEYVTDPFDSSNNDQTFYNGYGETHVMTRKNRSILPDLEPYPLTEDIKNEADVIYNKMIPRLHRSKIRNQMLFHCVYNAHLELDRHVNPVQLGKMFGLTQGEVERCDSIFSPLQTGYEPKCKTTSPTEYLTGFCEKMGISDEATANVIKLANNLLSKDPDLKEQRPQTVAAGILKYYTYIHGITTDDPYKINKVTDRSPVTIDSVFKKISDIDNS